MSFMGTIENEEIADWFLRKNSDKKFSETQVLKMKLLMAKGESFMYKYWIDNGKDVQFQKRENPINDYYLGAKVNYEYDIIVNEIHGGDIVKQTIIDPMGKITYKNPSKEEDLEK